MPQPTKTTLSLAVLSGKGGVGKSNLALNLAFALHKAGAKVLIMDFDVGLANMDVLLGIAPEKNLQDLLRDGVAAKDVVVAIEPRGREFLPAASGVPELLDMDEDAKDMLFGKLNQVFGAYDFLFLDLGAGINPLVMQVAAMAQTRLLIVTPEPTSLTDGYAVIKVLSCQRGVRDFLVVANQVATHAEGKATFERLALACKKFLDIDIVFFGSVLTDPAVPRAVRLQVPLLKSAPSSKAAKDILAVAARIVRFSRDNAENLRDLPILKKNTPQSP